MSAEQPESEQNPLEALKDAVQAFVNAVEDDGPLVTAAVLVFELMRYDDDTGDELRRISYTTPGFSASLSSSIGLLDAGLHIVRRDVIGEREEDE